MIHELMGTLSGEKPGTDIFSISYAYAERDFTDLLAYESERYDPERILRALKRERKRLQRVKRLHRCVVLSDRMFRTNREERLGMREFERAEERLYRFALMRDHGADARLIRKNRAVDDWAKKLFIDEKDDHLKFFESPDEFVRMAQEISGIDDVETFLWLHAYIREFIDICPLAYLENGTFGKCMRALFGVLFFSVFCENTDYENISRLSGYFATTYLFDDIMDDAGYTREEKDRYFHNVLAILESQRHEEITVSPDPVMAFSESAFVGMRDILDEKSGRMVAQSYRAIAEATSAGVLWTYSTPLTDTELYAIATIKAAYTRIIPAILAGHTIDTVFLSHCMRGGLIYQLTDDLRDMTDDLAEENVTPFNYYRHGTSPPALHPAGVFLAAVSRISDENLQNIPDAVDLWVMRISHSLRVLKLKYGDDHLKTLFLEVNFPDDRITRELALIGECCSVIIDIEAEAARNHSDIAVSMRGGWRNRPVYGH